MAGKRILDWAMAAAMVAVAGMLPLKALAQDEHALSADEQLAHDIYRDIIGFRTARGQEKVPDLVAYLVGRFQAAGFANADITVTDYDSNGEATQGLVVRYPAAKGASQKPVVLLGHMDVVDALAEDWVRPPFELTQEDGYFYGRGTIDNKYGIANLSQAFIRLKQQGWTPTRDLYLVFSGDEETGMVSTHAQAKWVAENIDPAFVLNSDAGGMLLGPNFTPLAFNVQAAEKTYATFEVTVTNPGGHSSRPRKDNAIYDLAAALTRISQHSFPVRETDLTRSYFAALAQTTEGPLGEAMRAFAADPTDKEAIATLRANPETVGTLGTTCVATMLRGGHAENALPQSATATVNCRIFPGVGAEEVEAVLASVIANDAVELKVLGEVTESPVSEVRDDVRAAIAASLAARGSDVPILAYMESGGTDGKHYRNLGYDTVAISGAATRPEDMFAHGLNERLSVDAFYAGLDHWIAILKALAGE